MGYGAHTIRDLLVTAVALSLAAAILTAPTPARSDGLSEPPRAAPRWSNDAHHQDGIRANDPCRALAPGYTSDYVPGHDAWGQPVIPAEVPKERPDFVPDEIELNIGLKQKQIGGFPVDLSARKFFFDAAGAGYGAGAAARRDCVSSHK